MYSNAKYTSTFNGSVSASVAKYVFNVSANDSYSTADTIANLKLGQTCDATTLVNGKIAPGTSGSFDIVIDAENSDVGIEYEVSFEDNNENKTITHTVTWEWPYETVGGDTNDTIDGQNGFNYQYDITVTGTQAEPV